MTKTLDELVNERDPGIVLIRRWIESAESSCEILPPSAARADVFSSAATDGRSRSQRPSI
jgi:hypothetical protein